jgi:hypothetical protein
MSLRNRAVNTQETTLTDSTTQADESKLWAEARDFSDRRAIIEQAKGMLMFLYGFDADEAFNTLRSHSQDHNVKLALIAEQVVKDLVELGRAKAPARKPEIDSVIIAARNRITNVAVRQLDGVSKTGVPMKDL